MSASAPPIVPDVARARTGRRRVVLGRRLGSAALVVGPVLNAAEAIVVGRLHDPTGTPAERATSIETHTLPLALALTAGIVAIPLTSAPPVSSRDRVAPVRGVMTIDRQYVELRDGSLVLDTPKTAAGVRTVHIPPHLVPELHAHLDSWTTPASPVIFPNSKDEPIRRASWRSVWLLARDKAGLPHFRFHDLRHTGNTLAAATGASTKELMARMGHASVRAALIYQHATTDRDAAIVAALSELAGQAAPASTRRGAGDTLNAAGRAKRPPSGSGLRSSDKGPRQAPTGAPADTDRVVR